MSDLWDNEKAATGSTVAEAEPTLYFNNANEFVQMFLARTYRRQVGQQKQYRWSRQWWNSPEAMIRLEALWRACTRALIDLQKRESTSSFQIYADPLSFFTFLEIPKLADSAICRAGWSQMTLSSTGEFLLCPHYRVSFGELKGKTAKDLWRQHTTIDDLRTNTPEACSGCAFRATCAGGCPGVIAALGLTPGIDRDPACFADLS